MPNSRQPSPETVFGKRVREQRKKAGMSQAEFATRLAEFNLKLDPSAIARAERGERLIRLNEALAFALALGCSLDYLLDPAPQANAREELERVEAQLREASNRLLMVTMTKQRTEVEVRSLEKRRQELAAEAELQESD